MVKSASFTSWSATLRLTRRRLPAPVTAADVCCRRKVYDSGIQPNKKVGQRSVVEEDLFMNGCCCGEHGRHRQEVAMAGAHATAAGG
jgi:hypothetical protein